VLSGLSGILPVVLENDVFTGGTLMKDVLKEKAIIIAERLVSNAGQLRYGSVAVTLKIHDGRVTEVLYTTSENTREPGDKKCLSV
jgi:hypothetical protein